MSLHYHFNNCTITVCQVSNIYAISKPTFTPTYMSAYDISQHLCQHQRQHPNQHLRQHLVRYQIHRYFTPTSTNLSTFKPKSTSTSHLPIIESSLWFTQKYQLEDSNRHCNSHGNVSLDHRIVTVICIKMLAKLACNPLLKFVAEFHCQFQHYHVILHQVIMQSTEFCHWFLSLIPRLRRILSLSLTS